MKRKSMVTVWVAILGLALLWVGCPKKKPVAPPPAPVVEEVVEPAEEVAPAPAPPVQDQTPDIMDMELQALNERAYREGLLGDVYFDFDKYDLKPEARERLAKNAEFMKQYPGLTFSVEGHCDERGTNEYNLALGDRRANAAKGYLGSLGVSEGRMRIISYGEERPVCGEHSEGCWWKNRRAHFVVTGKAGG